ncbi:uncharacterized protein BP5553_04589 [Venustampulla echinocandica]|uniref:Uncharacterized protein n=1 Tax=Venustampulla echinocandica TaxID=2656787 RepID=A0A370TNR1_9HELO|nr:uncharacterized protein BP5553_04589 [Venustampulla echinocandica]RDL37156.1 hypothetical protein BP5553_04589 [Venustampulla echinocandica]
MPDAKVKTQYLRTNISTVQCSSRMFIIATIPRINQEGETPLATAYFPTKHQPPLFIGPALITLNTRQAASSASPPRTRAMTALAIAIPAIAPVDNPPERSDFADAFEGVMEGIFEGVFDGVVFRDETELLDVVAADDRLEVVPLGTNVETVAPAEPRVTVPVLRDTWNRPIPE